MAKLAKRFVFVFLTALLACTLLLGGCAPAGSAGRREGGSDTMKQEVTGSAGLSEAEETAPEETAPPEEDMSDDVQQGGGEAELPVPEGTRRYLRTDKEIYQADTQKIYVSAGGSADGWVGIWAAGADVQSSEPEASATLRELGGVRWCVPASDLGEGEYKVVLFDGEGTSRQKNSCSVTVVGNAVYTNKEEYFQNEEIVVMPYGDVGSWVGMFRKEDTPSAAACLGRFDFNVNSASGSGLGYIMQEAGNAPDSLSPGEYKLVVFTETDNYESAAAQTEFTVVGGEAGEAAPPVSVLFNVDSLDAGVASGTVMLSFNKNKFNASEVVAYWADDEGVLEEFAAFGGQRVTGTVMRYYALEQVYIPEGATNLRFYGRNVNGQGSSYYRLDLPAGCNYERGEALSVFALLSDIHIDAAVPANSENFQKALRDIVAVAPENDGVFVVGDVTNDGKATEWALTEQLVAEVEEEKSADLSMYYMIGNHDFYQCYTDGGRPGLTFAEAMEPYRELMGITDEDPNVTYYSRQVNGVYHIVLGTEERDGNWVDARISDTQLAWLEEQLEIAEAADPDMPVFVYLHQPMTDTTAGTLPGQGWDHVRTWDEQTQSWVNDVQPIRDILAAHPQAFFINGHNHRDLNNTYRIAYFASSELPNNIVQTGGTAYLSDTWGSSEGHQGWYVYVYGSEVLFLGREFTTGKWLPGACLLFSV